MKRWITFYILFILMLGSIGIKAFPLSSKSVGSPRAPLHYVSSFSDAVKNDYSSRWNSGDIREMGSVVGEGLITLLAAGVKYADNAGRLGKTGAFIQKLRKIKNLKRLRKLKASKSAKLYHYTGANPNKIAAEGLIPGGSGKVFTTPSGKLSPLQAQLDLALPPNRGLPNHLLEIDIPTLQGMGMKVPQEGPVGRMFNMPGGGTEIVFPHAIPAEAIKVVR